MKLLGTSSPSLGGGGRCSSFSARLLALGQAQGCLVLRREAPASWNLGWLLMENSGLCFTMPFWSLGPQKQSVMLNYSEAHISSVSKKFSPTGKKCHKLFIALCFRSGVGSSSGAASSAARGYPCWPLGISAQFCLGESGAGWSMGWCQGRSPWLRSLFFH